MCGDKVRVLVGMSGGIDSSAACMMLQEQGYEVVGMTMRVWDSGSSYLEDAGALAASLGIEHHVVDEREAFKKEIIGYFIGEYLRGRTPNPCVMCNELFKFRLLCGLADKLGCRYIATGHYSRITDMHGHKYILTGEDAGKDQSYFLWRLDESVLQRLLLPLGGMTKADVRKYLLGKGYEAKASGGESMEVCFVKGDYRDFLKEMAPDRMVLVEEGFFVDSSGRKLGTHKGYPYYTIGQRKGLGIALGHPVYVLKINPEKNTVMLGDEDRLKAAYMLVEDWKVIDEADFFSGRHRLQVRIRYRSRAVECAVCRIDSRRMLVRFETPVAAVTPGQSAVFYDDGVLLGGAFIASQKELGVLLNSGEELEFV